MAFDHDEYLRLLRAETSRVAALLATGPLTAPIVACPGWTLSDLGIHLGQVHHWAARAAQSGERTMFEEIRPADEQSLDAWYRGYADKLVHTLEHIDPDAPTWHLFTVERIGRFWPRRQTHETLVHRWDAEHAIGALTAIDPALASDSVDEYFEVALPRMMKRDGLSLPTSSFHVHCTDTPGEWTLRAGDDGSLVMTREHAKGDAALRGRAEDLLLRLWGRPVSETALDVVGDPQAAHDWLALGGM
jgi:uncharacterized protein (TIGR03083 family)